MKRVFLFLATNFAITIVLFFAWNLLGLGSILDERRRVAGIGDGVANAAEAGGFRILPPDYL